MADRDEVKFLIDQASYRRTLAYLSALAAATPQAAAEELTMIAFEWQRLVVRHMPVDKGLARNSVAVVAAQFDGSTVQSAVGTNVAYVPYLEFGTERIAGGQVLDWQPGQQPILHWLAKDVGRYQLEHQAADAGSAANRVAVEASYSNAQEEFMPPFRGSWQLIAEESILRLRRRLALSLRNAA